VADVSYQEGPAQISRDDTKRRITIGVNARNRDIESLVSEIQERLEAELDLPVGYSVTFGGQFENLRRARARLSVAVPAALLLIFVLLFLTFNSVKQTLLIYTAIPLSAIGGIWALYLRGMAFSISAGVGFIALFGVAVLNGIVLIGQFNQLKKEGVDNTLVRIYQGTRVRLRPVIMTAAVASLGFLPMAISTTAGAEVQQPLATVVIGGLISATFLTLILLPILYYYAEEGLRRRPSGKAPLWLIPVFFTLGPRQSPAQPPTISLDEALEMAVEQHPDLSTLRLESQRQEQLVEGSALQPPANIYFSGEEINFTPSQGIHSFGVWQNFNLPKAQNALKTAQKAQVELSLNAVALSANQIRRELRYYYYQLVQIRERESLLRQLQQEYAQFEQLAAARKDLGETGRLPLLAVQAKAREAQWTLDQLRNEYQVNLLRFNQWLASDTLFTPRDSLLPAPEAPGMTTGVVSPFILQQSLAVEAAEAQMEVEQTQLLPQLNTGFQAQSVGGQFIFWGYQIGVNMPLFRKGQKARIEAAEKAVLVQEQALRGAEYQYNRETAALRQSLQTQRAQLISLEGDLLPLARLQSETARDAYRLGEATYLDYLQALENIYRLELQRSEALKQFHLTHAEWLYLNGR
jgi:cobalt-zinc-cadmium resistance protein CzcA